MGSRSHVLAHRSAPRGLCCFRCLFHGPSRAARRTVRSSTVTAVFPLLLLLAFASCLTPAEGKREAKARGSNCTHSVGALQVLATAADGEKQGENGAAGAVGIFLPKIFRDNMGLPYSRWMWRSRHSTHAYVPMLPRNKTALEASVLLDVWGGGSGGNTASRVLCAGNNEGDMVGCRSTCMCPWTQQCYVHNQETEGEKKDVGECSISMSLQVVISLATIGLLICMLLLVRMALIQHQVRQELLQRENQQRNNIIRGMDRRKYSTSKKREDSGSKRLAAAAGAGAALGARPSPSAKQRGSTPERPNAKQKLKKQAMIAEPPASGTSGDDGG